jgi:glucose dehydrogenase
LIRRETDSMGHRPAVRDAGLVLPIMPKLHRTTPAPLSTASEFYTVPLTRSTTYRDLRMKRSSAHPLRRFLIQALLPLVVAALAAASKHKSAAQSDWPVYGGQKAGDRYSNLRQINRKTVGKLAQAWRFDIAEKGGLQTNPLVVGRTLYAYSPMGAVIALDGATGKQVWRFDPGTPQLQPSRGFAFWTDGQQKVLFAAVMNDLYALDPGTGKPIATFGEGGKIDARKGLAEGDVTHSFLAMTTPGVIYKDMIVVGFRDPETEPALHGDIRAFDVHTGRERWSFHTIPHPGEPGYETWPKDAWKVTGAANNWCGMSLDEQRGIVYAPTGSAVDDFYGADRLGNDLYADTLIALDANTGKEIWHFQGVHHDIWDRDFPSPPSLVTVQSHGKKVDAVAQTTKEGFLFLFDRATGRPLFPIEERAFPPSHVPGEQAAPTQPVALMPAPFARQMLTADMLTTRTPQAHAWAVEQFKNLAGGGLYVPFSVDKQTIVFPGFDGGAEWGGSAVDPKTGVIYVNANDIAWEGGLTANKPEAGLGGRVYQNQCSVCHGTDRKGSPPAFPSLVDIHTRLSTAEITVVIQNGKGRMPAFRNFDQPQLTALLEYLETGQEKKVTPANIEAAVTAQNPGKREVESEMGPAGVGLPFRFTGYHKFLDPEGYPAVAPPWGTLNAIDLNTGRYRWKIPLGNYPELAAKGLANTGSENYGGPIVTAGGVLFIGATIYDHKFRAFNTDTGDLLWSADLPYAGNATPATYMIDGKQYVVIATSGQRNAKGPQGAAYVAFALP